MTEDRSRASRWTPAPACDLTLPAPSPPRLVFRALGNVHLSEYKSAHSVLSRIPSGARCRNGSPETGSERAAGNSGNSFPEAAGCSCPGETCSTSSENSPDGGPLVSLTVPVSPRLQRILKNYVERGGFTGMIRGAKASDQPLSPRSLRRSREPSAVPTSSIPMAAEISPSSLASSGSTCADTRNSTFSR